MSYEYNVGDHVVCVDARFEDWVKKLYTALPVAGVQYVVREMRLGVATDCKTGEVSITLCGLVNPPTEGRSQLERGFAAWRFVPLQNFKAMDSRPEAEPSRKPEIVEIAA